MTSYKFALISTANREYMVSFEMGEVYTGSEKAYFGEIAFVASWINFPHFDTVYTALHCLDPQFWARITSSKNN